MVEISKSKASKCKIQIIEFGHTTIFDDRFKNGSFDAIIAFNIFHLFEELQKSIERINELLKQGGLIISATP